MLRSSSVWVLAAALLAGADPALAQPAAVPAAPAALQPQPIKRTPLQRIDVPGTAFETVIGIAEIAPGVNIGRHLHPGPESGDVTEGSFERLIDGEAPRLVQAGDSCQAPARTVCDARSGAAGARVIATCVVEKGQPLATPARRARRAGLRCRCPTPAPDPSSRAARLEEPSPCGSGPGLASSGEEAQGR